MIKTRAVLKFVCLIITPLVVASGVLAYPVLSWTRHAHLLSSAVSELIAFVLAATAISIVGGTFALLRRVLLKINNSKCKEATSEK